MLGFPGGSAGKESAHNVRDLGSIPGLGRSPGEGIGYPLQYSGLENSMDCIVHGVTKSPTRPSNFHFHPQHHFACFHTSTRKFKSGQEKRRGLCAGSIKVAGKDLDSGFTVQTGCPPSPPPFQGSHTFPFRQSALAPLTFSSLLLSRQRKGGRQITEHYNLTTPGGEASRASHMKAARP